MSTVHSSIDHHPDILALRERYGRVAESMTAQGTFGFTLVAAVYAAVSPWIVGFDGTRPLAVNDLVVGLVCVALVFGFAMALDRSHGMTWALPVFGVWFIISPWVLHGVSPHGGMIWSNVIAGAVLAVLGLNAMYFGMRARSSTSA
ncbi:SPW repeat protein [Candidatus Mycobacterium methanotrophicum]|uniref:SPW repeat protein n=1 Tax=Candidatus Mycobacterium methanotrophicum TaxID=2943498 RepID=A0ABY4QIQ8_9MYCO|nr:SPW repeat protein [Candidatus Mycobacterium methanotrophicum]UQX10873.1 SPW repeat protein [Candidatus Mycobacterium methanotrophicum]